MKEKRRGLLSSFIKDERKRKRGILLRVAKRSLRFHKKINYLVVSHQSWSHHPKRKKETPSSLHGLKKLYTIACKPA
jgi:hypothetical protein